MTPLPLMESRRVRPAGVETAADHREALSIAAEIHRREADDLARLAYLATGDEQAAERAVEDAFVSLLRHPRRATIATAVLAESRPAAHTAEDEVGLVAEVRALPIDQRDAVLRACFLRDQRAAPRRTLHAGLAALGAGPGAVGDALDAAAAEADVTPPPWDRIVARAGRADGRRHHRLMAAAAAAGVAAVAIAVLPGQTDGKRTQRIETDHTVRPGPAPAPGSVPPPLGAIVAVFDDGRAVQLAADGRTTADLGRLPGAPLVPGQVELAVTDFGLYAARRDTAANVVFFLGGPQPVAVADGHSPATAADGWMAWVAPDRGGPEAIVAHGGSADRRWPVGVVGTQLSSLSWSPDSRYLVFQLQKAGTDPEVRILDTHVDASLDSTRRLGPWRSPRWLPDGDLVVLDVTGTLVSIVDPDSLQSVSNRVEGAPAVAVDADEHGDLLTVHADRTFSVNGRVVATGVVAAAWRT